ncbi:hypothetical protein [Amycolatopsis sp. NPDC059657]|uniref:hypothetical protein n=1 Tax=Amycolatopsis sp. NPDC059657 TaxID=3346899 RepID=UPI00366D87E5
MRIGDFSETFHAPLGYWTVSDYRRSWRQSILRLNTSDEVTSCLMVAMTDPGESNFLMSWPMYRLGEVLYVQNSIIFLDQLEHAFDPNNPWLSVREREVVDEDGNRISEWSTTMNSVRELIQGWQTIE